MQTHGTVSTRMSAYTYSLIHVRMHALELVHILVYIDELYAYICLFAYTIREKTKVDRWIDENQVQRLGRHRWERQVRTRKLCPGGSKKQQLEDPLQHRRTYALSGGSHTLCMTELSLEMP